MTQIVRTVQVIQPTVDFRLGSRPELFDVAEFDKLLETKGYLVTWEKAAFCPNIPRDGVAPGRHDINCDLCDARGFVYFESCDTEMLVQAVKLSQQYQSQGRWDVGMVLVTARPGYKISWRDRIVLRNGTARFTELVCRQPLGTPDVLKYVPLCVEYVAWAGRDKTIAEFEPGVDFTTSEHLLTWRGGGPDFGAYYTISYEYRPRYIIDELLHVHRESPDKGGARTAFPAQGVARHDFIVRDESRDAPEAPDDGSPFKFRRDF